jgi:hypothetical protein
MKALASRHACASPPPRACRVPPSSPAAPHHSLRHPHAQLLVGHRHVPYARPQAGGARPSRAACPPHLSTAAPRAPPVPCVARVGIRMWMCGCVRMTIMWRVEGKRCGGRKGGEDGARTRGQMRQSVNRPAPPSASQRSLRGALQTRRREGRGGPLIEHGPHDRVTPPRMGRSDTSRFSSRRSHLVPVGWGGVRPLTPTWKPGERARSGATRTTPRRKLGARGLPAPSADLPAHPWRTHRGLPAPAPRRTCSF